MRLSLCATMLAVGAWACAEPSHTPRKDARDAGAATSMDPEPFDASTDAGSGPEPVMDAGGGEPESPADASADAAASDASADADVADAAAPVPRLISSSPAHGALDVYPSPLWSGNGEEVVIQLRFSEPMTLTDELVLQGPDHERPIAEVEWSDDHTELTLFVRPDFLEPRALRDDTEYSLATSALVSLRGVALEPSVGLEEGCLVFTTGRHDALLNHSCGHTFFGPFADIVAGRSDDASAPDISTTHTQYTVTLRADGDEFRGWLRATFPSEGPYRLYFDAATTVAIENSSSDEPHAVTVSPTPPACPGITQELTVMPGVGENLFFGLGPEGNPQRRVIVELVTQDVTSNTPAEQHIESSNRND